MKRWLRERQPLALRFSHLEPGGVRTNWSKRAASALPELLSEYEESVGKVLGLLDDYWGRENSDS